MRRPRHGLRPHAALAAAACVLAGCNSMVAQNPGTPMRPVNAVRQGDELRLMLGGRDVVSYFVAGVPVQGQPRWRTEFEGVAFYFADAANQARFEAQPQAYLPAYRGFCAMSMVYAVPRRGDPDVWMVVDGRLLLFADASALAAFRRDSASNLAQADRYWGEQVDGRVAEWQRLRRWVDSVPGYKSPSELASEVEATPGS
jgi:YHS domain-containing protein